MEVLAKSQEHVLASIPASISDLQTLSLLQSLDIDSTYIRILKNIAKQKDETISDWLHLNVKTFRKYKNQNQEVALNIKEQLLLLLSLYKHGIETFGSSESFNKWLSEENFYFDGKAPITFLNTISGIRFIDDRLTAMEYGDNV